MPANKEALDALRLEALGIVSIIVPPKPAFPEQKSPSITLFCSKLDGLMRNTFLSALGHSPRNPWHASIVHGCAYLVQCVGR